MTHIQQRRDNFAIWTMLNPVLMEGEAGHEKDTGRWKLGDGVTPYNDLPYKSGVDSVAGMTGDVDLDVGDIAGAAPLLNPEFTGSPAAPTPTVSSNSTRIATTEWVKLQAYATKLDPAFLGNPSAPTPATSDNDTTLATTAFVKNVLNESPALGGNPTAPTPAASDNDTSIATTAFVKSLLARTTSTTAFTFDPNTTGLITFVREGNTIHFCYEIKVLIAWPPYSFSLGNVSTLYRPSHRWELTSAATTGVAYPLLFNTDGSIQSRSTIPINTTVFGSATYAAAV